MIAVIFEVWPADGERAHYLDVAASLREELIKIDGFISVERFQSITDPAKMLAWSFWREEAAVSDGRSREHHRKAQAIGRSGVFADYRLRIATVMRDYGLDRREEAPADSRAIHDKMRS